MNKAELLNKLSETKRAFEGAQVLKNGALVNSTIKLKLQKPKQ